MALVAAAVCPHPPLLVPEVSAREPVAARAPALEAARRLVASRPEVVVVVGDDRETTAYTGSDSGSFDGFGVDLRVSLGPRACDGQAVLPLSLTVGAWLLRRTGWTGDRQGYGISRRAGAADAAAAGGAIAGLGERVALLVMGDGSARRGPKAPGSEDDRARGYDAAVGAALAAADPAALLALDPDLALDLLATGRASWQVLAGAALAAGAPAGGWLGDLTYDDAPFGVGYFVASWEPAP
jgi:hypothetical protein